mmetsp:Transcript_23125/g.53155  ORF Transcript_23125/g.53155 Transcript_23125/m.53155 type:complete len:759 (-) Transcript_23125:109-2385(-)
MATVDAPDLTAAIECDSAETTASESTEDVLATDKVHAQLLRLHHMLDDRSESQVKSLQELQSCCDSVRRRAQQAKLEFQEQYHALTSRLTEKLDDTLSGDGDECLSVWKPPARGSLEASLAAPRTRHLVLLHALDVVAGIAWRVQKRELLIRVFDAWATCRCVERLQTPFSDLDFFDVEEDGTLPLCHADGYVPEDVLGLVAEHVKLQAEMEFWSKEALHLANASASMSSFGVQDLMEGSEVEELEGCANIPEECQRLSTMEVFCDTESLDGSKAKGTVASTRTAMDATFEEEADERVEQVEVLQCAPSTAPDEFGGSDCSSSGKEASAPLQAESEAVCDADEASAIPESMHSLGSEDVLRPNSEDAGEDDTGMNLEECMLDDISLALVDEVPGSVFESNSLSDCGCDPEQMEILPSLPTRLQSDQLFGGARLAEGTVGDSCMHFSIYTPSVQTRSLRSPSEEFLDCMEELSFFDADNESQMDKVILSDEAEDPVCHDDMLLALNSDTKNNHMHVRLDSPQSASSRMRDMTTDLSAVATSLCGAGMQTTARPSSTPSNEHKSESSEQAPHDAEHACDSETSEGGASEAQQVEDSHVLEEAEHVSSSSAQPRHEETQSKESTANQCSEGGGNDQKDVEQEATEEVRVEGNKTSSSSTPEEHGGVSQASHSSLRMCPTQSWKCCMRRRQSPDCIEHQAEADMPRQLASLHHCGDGGSEERTPMGCEARGSAARADEVLVASAVDLELGADAASSSDQDPA